MKRVYSFLLIAALILTAIPFSGVSLYAATSDFAGGKGTTKDPYLIATKDHLNNVRKNLRAHYKMIADIDFLDTDFIEGGKFYNNGSGWKTIGTAITSFTGTFDGNNHCISNLYINIISDDVVYAGLFSTNHGTIKNLGIIDGKISASSSSFVYAGAIAGENYEGTITNCYNASAISASTTYSIGYVHSFVGGIVGSNYEGTITNCHNKGAISAFSYSSSDIVASGIADNGSRGEILNCYNTGPVSASAPYIDGVAVAGGIASSNAGTIANSYNTGEISADAYSSAAAGGIIGEHLITMTNCYNTGTVSGSHSVGGIVGLLKYNFSGSITNCYNVGDVSGQQNVGGVVGVMRDKFNGIMANCYYLDNITNGVGSGNDYTEKCTSKQLRQQSTYIDFDFEDTWEFVEGNAYPYPTFKNNEFFLIADTLEFNCGSGTEESPYCIATAKQLNNVREYPNSHFKLVKDIIFTDFDFEKGGDFYNNGAGWEPIGDDSKAFKGSFDGNGKIIKNLHITSSLDDYVQVGVFGYNSGTIKNLGLVDGNIYFSHQSIQFWGGGIVGINSNKIENCYNIGGSMSATSQYVDLGGIVGFNLNGATITNCYNTSNITALPSTSVGLAGGIAGNNSGVITNCYNSGNILSTSSDASVDAGGIAGVNNTAIKNCYNTASVTAITSLSATSGPLANAGGIVGSSDGELTNCYNLATVVCSHNEGGIVGINWMNANITNCYYINRIPQGIGVGDGSAIKCTIDELNKQSTFEGFDFENIWTMAGNSYYPFPELQSTPMAINTGDVNGNEIVSAADPVILLRAIAGNHDVQGIDRLAADVDYDGELTTADVVAILQLMLNKRYY